jgi:hypothetical protein
MLSSADMLALFEQGTGLHVLDRALLVLAFGYPECAHDELVSLTLGQRDASLLGLRVSLFGDRLECLAECPACGERVELEVSCRDLLATRAEPGPSRVRIGALELTLRAPDSRDLAAVAALDGVEQASELLFARCVQGGGEVALTAADRAALADAILAADPHAETLLALACPRCGGAWQPAFDIASYLWTEVAGEAQRVLREVDVLARVYGWSEADILGLSDTRRSLYVRMALS